MKKKMFSFSKRIIVILSICIILGLGSTFFAVWNVYNYKQQGIKNTQNELSIHVEIISNGINEIFREHYKNLKTLATEPDIIDAFLHQEAHDFSKEFCSIDNLLTQHQPEISSVTIIDKKGLMFHRHPFITDSIIDYSDKDDVAYVLQYKKTYISDVFINSEDKSSLSISHPVFDKNNFIGIVRITVYLETITKLFIVPIEINKRQVTILNNNGDFLHHSDEYLINKNYKELILGFKATFPKKNWKSIEEMMERINKKETGVTVFEYVSGKTNKIQKNIAAYGSVQVFNKTFFIVVSKDYNLVILPTKQYINKFWIFILTILILFSIVTITLLNSRKKRLMLLKENEYLKKISDKDIAIKEQDDEYSALGEEYNAQHESLSSAYEQIEENEQYLRSIFKSAPVGIGVVHNRMLTFINDRFCEITGYEREDLINKSAEMLYPNKDEYERVGKYKYEQIKKYGTGSIETILKKKDGKLINILLSSTPIDINDLGKGVTFSALDITERGKAEKELQLQAAIMFNVAEGIYIIGMDDLIIKWTNEKFAIMFGYDLGEMVGKHVDIVNAPIESTSSEIWKSIVDVLKETEEWHGEVKNIKRDGTTFWCYANVSLFDHPEYGKVIVSVHTDITERKKAEAKLLKNQYYLTKAQEIGIIGSWELDIQKNKLNWTKENYKIFGVPEETEMNVELFMNYVHPDDKDYVLKSWNAGLNKEPYDIEHRIIVNGKVKWLREKADIDFDSNGKAIMAVGFTQDITEQKKVEFELQKKEELLNATQQLTKVGGWEWNVLKQTMHWTNETYRIHEIMPGSIMAGSIKHIEQGLKCYEPDDKPKVLEAFNSCVKKGIPYDLEYPFTTTKGKNIWIHTTAKAIKEKGKIVRVIGNIVDITERKLSEISLTKEKEFSEKILNTSSAIIVGLDKDHLIKIFNEGAEKITGYKKDEVIGKDWFKLFFPPELIKKMNKVWKDAWGVSTHSYINQILTKKKKERIISWQTTGFYKEKPERNNLLISIGEDITERTSVGIKLKESKETQDKILGAFDDGTYLCSSDYEIQYLNSAMKAKIGYDAIGTKCYKAINNSDEICSWCYFEDLKKKKKSKVVIEVRRNNKYYIVTSVLLKDNSKLTVYHDITDRKQAEIALSESEAKFKMLFNSSLDAILLINKEGSIIEVNKVSIKKYSYSRKSFLNMQLKDLSPLADKEKMINNLEFIIKSTELKFKLKHQKANGDIFPVEIFTKQIIFNNEIVFLILAHDISEQEKSQQQIFNATINAEEKERTRVSRDIHDGVSPMLSALKIYIQSLKKHEKKEIVDEIHNRIELTIDETIESISEISNNLSPHILRNFGLEKAIESFADKIKKIRNIKIKIKVDNIDELELNKATTLYRVTTELINNTLKHSTANKIAIKIKKATDVNYVYTDNGQGFDIKNIKTKGMGLFNLSNRIKSLKGSIKFINKNGTKVVICIPFK